MAGRITPQSGFSLVELMIVVAVLSILSLGAVLAINLRDPRGSRDVAWLEQTFATARREAILTRREARFAISPTGVTRMAPGEGGWQPEGAESALDGLVTATAGYGALRDDLGRVIIALLPDGRTSAFDLRLEAGRQVWTCAADGWGALACDGES